MQLAAVVRKYERKITQSFMPNFPFAAHDKRSVKTGRGSNKARNQKQQPVTVDTPMVTLNLGMCQVG